MNNFSVSVFKILGMIFTFLPYLSIQWKKNTYKISGQTHEIKMKNIVEICKTKKLLGFCTLHILFK